MNQVADAPDEELLSRIGATQDRAAFAELFTRYAGRIKAFLIKSGAEPGEADETTQEVFVSVWRRANTYDPAKASAATWVFAITRNRRIDLIRRQRRPEPDPNDPLFAPDPPDSPERALSGESRDQVVRQALEELPSAQRSIVQMAFYEGLTHVEIASALDLPLGTVKSRLRLAFSRLRGALGVEFRMELDDA